MMICRPQSWPPHKTGVAKLSSSSNGRQSTIKQVTLVTIAASLILLLSAVPIAHLQTNFAKDQAAKEPKNQLFIDKLINGSSQQPQQQHQRFLLASNAANNKSVVAITAAAASSISSSSSSRMINQQTNKQQVVSSTNRQQQQQSIANNKSAKETSIVRRSSEPTQSGNSRLQQQQQQSNNNQQTTNNTRNSSLVFIRQRWRQMELSIGDSLDSLSLSLKSTLDELSTNNNKQNSTISSDCKLALNELLAALGQQKLWAAQTIDASARLPSGLLEGTLTELGNFDQCLAIRYPNILDQQQQSFAALRLPNQNVGQYCSIQIKPPLMQRPRLHTVCQPLQNLLSIQSGAQNQSSLSALKLFAQNSHQFHYVGLRLGLCTPSKCTRLDIQHLLTNYLAKYELLGQVKSCQTAPDEREQQLDFVQQCILSSFVALFVLILIGTLVDSFSSSQVTSIIQLPTSHIVSSKSASSSDESSNEFKQTTNLHCLESDEATKAKANQQQQAHLLMLNRHELGIQGKRWSHLGQIYQTTGELGGNHKSGQQLNLLATNEQPPLPPPRSSQHAAGFLFGAKPVKAYNVDQMYDMDEIEDENGNVCEEEETWIARLEENQREMFATSGNIKKNNKRLTDKLKQKQKQQSTRADDEGEEVRQKRWRHILRSLLICFSIKKNLASIGKHSSKVSASAIASQKSCLLQPPIETLSPPPAAAAVTTTTAATTQNVASGAATGNSNNMISINSFSGNGNRVQQQQQQQQQDEMSDIKVIHGLRTITMIWIIFGHTIGLVNPEMMNNLFSLAQLSCSSRLLQALLNATLAVNTFFMISGLVTVISFARKCKSAQQLLLIGNNCFGKLEPKTQTILIGNEKHRVYHHHHHHHHNQSSKESCSEPELWSVDSSSIISSLSSSASSDRCISGQINRRGNNNNYDQFKRSGGLVNGLNNNNNNNNKKKKKKRIHQSQSVDCVQNQLTNKKTNTSSSCKSSSGLPNDFKPLLWLTMRYLRLTPAYATIVGFSILMPALGSGPFWQETAGSLGPTCRNSWWLNLLYVNNFIGTDKLCLIHSWYLSNDWQFFVLTLLLFATFYKSKKIALLLLITFGVASTAATFVVTVTNELPPTIVTTSPAVAERWLFIHSLYYKPWPHLPSYLVGLLVGYLILIKNRIRMSSTWRRFNWILFTLVAISLLNSIYPWNMGLQVEPLITGLHSATFRTLWSACCGWLIFALATKPNNLIARLLSWHGFQVTSRLTYCAYLVHPLIIYYHFGTLRERIDSSPFGQFHRFMATLGLSYLFALLLALLVEGPSIQIQLLLSKCLGFSGNFPSTTSSNNSTLSKMSSDGCFDKLKRRNNNCNSTTNHSWTATSSFVDQDNNRSSPLVTGIVRCSTQSFNVNSTPASRSQSDSNGFSNESICTNIENNNNNKQSSPIFSTQMLLVNSKEVATNHQLECSIPSDEISKETRDKVSSKQESVHSSAISLVPIGGSQTINTSSSNNKQIQVLDESFTGRQMDDFSATQNHCKRQLNEEDLGPTSFEFSCKGNQPIQLINQSPEKQTTNSIDDDDCKHFEQNQLKKQHSSELLLSSSSSSGAPSISSSALDADFQRKLAQAISRGFRIRTRIANGTIRQQKQVEAALVINQSPLRRATNQIKRLPQQNSTSTNGTHLTLSAKQMNDVKMVKQHQQHSMSDIVNAFNIAHDQHSIQMAAAKQNSYSSQQQLLATTKSTSNSGKYLTGRHHYHHHHLQMPKQQQQQQQQQQQRGFYGASNEFSTFLATPSNVNLDGSALCRGHQLQTALDSRLRRQSQDLTQTNNNNYQQQQQQQQQLAKQSQTSMDSNANLNSATNLNELIQMKQKLPSRSQSHNDVKR